MSSYYKWLTTGMEEYNQDSLLSAISEMPRITCTLGTHEIPELVFLYQPLLVRCARSIELIPHLKKVINDGKYVHMVPNQHYFNGNKSIELHYLSLRWRKWYKKTKTIMTWLKRIVCFWRSTVADFPCFLVLPRFVVACQEIDQISRTQGDIASMECLLNHLEKSNHPKKWHKFVDALEKKGWFVYVSSCFISHY